jgi:hypothetical protein
VGTAAPPSVRTTVNPATSAVAALLDASTSSGAGTSTRDMASKVRISISSWSDTAAATGACQDPSATTAAARIRPGRSVEHVHNTHIHLSGCHAHGAPRAAVPPDTSAPKPRLTCGEAVQLAAAIASTRTTTISSTHRRIPPLHGWLAAWGPPPVPCGAICINMSPRIRTGNRCRGCSKEDSFRQEQGLSTAVALVLRIDSRGWLDNLAGHGGGRAHLVSVACSRQPVQRGGPP